MDRRPAPTATAPHIYPASFRRNLTPSKRLRYSGDVWDAKIDDVIAEVEAEIEERSMAHRLEVERIKEAHEEEMRPLYDALEHLRQARVGALTGRKTPGATPLLHQSFKVNAASKTGAKTARKFPVKREVQKLVRILDGEYSPKKIEDILDKKFPGVADQINHSSVHRALQDLVTAGEVIKLGVGRYKTKGR